MATFPLYLRHTAETAMSEKIQAKLDRELPAVHEQTSQRLAGDPFGLRGIPVVGVRGGIGGAVPGSRP